MARVPLVPPGCARDAFLDAATFEKNELAMHALDQMLTARERVERLPNSDRGGLDAPISTHCDSAGFRYDTRALPGWTPRATQRPR